MRTLTALSQNADSIRYQEISKYLIERNECIERNEWYIQQLIKADSLILESEQNRDTKESIIIDNTNLALNEAKRDSIKDSEIKKLQRKLKNRNILLGGTAGALLAIVLISFL